MALPLTGISVSLVRDTIGAGSNDVGTLFLHPNVNEWGFNCPDSNLQDKIWGKPSSIREDLSPLDPDYTPALGVRPGYHLGAFRGYDHDWVAYSLGPIEMTPTYMDESGNYVGRMTFTVPIILVDDKLIGKPVPSPAVEHIFKLEFARNANGFDMGNFTVINDNFVTYYPSVSFYIDSLYPPDYVTNGSLSSNEPFYIKVTHLSSPERRWGLEFSGLILSFVTPVNPYTEVATLQNVSAVAVKKTTAPALTLFEVNADLFSDFSTGTTVTIVAIMSVSADFQTDVYTQTQNKYCAKNNNPGVPKSEGHLEFNFSNSGIANNVSVGQTVYYRLWLNGNQVLSNSVVVDDEIPIED